MIKISQKRYNEGDIIYFPELTSKGKYEVKWGMVDEQFHDAICIDFLEPKECRYVDGVPIDEFIKDCNQKKRKKLPKGWTWNTELFKLEWKRDPKDEELMKGFSIDKPEDIKKAYDLGLLVKSDTIFHGNIDTDITKEGYRVIVKYPMWQHVRTHTSVYPFNAYSTYDEAKEVVDKNNAEIERQASLSDYDWSVEQIDKTLSRYQKLTDEPDHIIEKYRKFILNLSCVEDVETRISDGNIQWKYWKHKKWNNISLI